MQPKPIHAGAARGIAIAAVLMLSAAGSAAAAGVGYGGGGGASPVTPVGFSSVVTVQTVTPQGASFSTQGASGTITVDVPKNATTHTIQIAITKGSNQTAQRDLPRSLRHYKVVSSFGVEVRDGTTIVRTTKPVSITLNASDIKRGDVILVYSPATGKFIKLTDVTVKNGKVVVHLKGDESLAIAAPRRKS